MRDCFRNFFRKARHLLPLATTTTTTAAATASFTTTTGPKLSSAMDDLQTLKTRLCIIGSGPAAHTAAIYAARAELKPILFEGWMANDIAPGGQLTTTSDVENFPGFPDGILGMEITERFRCQSLRFGTQIFTETVNKVDFSSTPFKIFTDSKTVVADTVIVATGAVAKRLIFPGSGDGKGGFWNRGISACAVCDGAAPIFRNKPLAVIGGGDSAMEEATFLTKYGSKVYILHRRDEFRASKIMQNRALSNPKIEVLWNSTVVEAYGEGEKGTLGGLKVKNSGQPQFRYTQTPSKVLHLRNLPWECTEEELVELCKPFGKIVNTKCNVSANRNQAFVEFIDLNQAINMVTYYASSSEPASVRGKTVYIQYSNRHEIVNNKGPGGVPGNVLLETIESVEAGDVSIDVIHLVFSAFGFVHKIATFEKAAGFQALIQFSDADTALSARESLDGRSIPRYLLPDHVGSCHLRISYSAHTDLNIKFQSHRSRDYTNPYLPVNATAIEGFVQPVVGPDGKKKEPESNVLLASIENMLYAVTVDVLHTVFSAFGTVQKIAIFEKNGGTQALIQYPDISTAAVAKDALEGHCIYDGGYCKLHLSYSRHTDLNVKAYSDKSRDYTVPESGVLAIQQSSGIPAAATGWQNPQAGSSFPGNAYTAGGSVQPQGHSGQAPSWDPTMQAGRSSYVSVRSTFPGQTYTSPSVPAYATAATPGGFSPHGHTSQINPSAPSVRGAQPAHQLNLPPGGSSPQIHPPYYS